MNRSSPKSRSGSRRWLLVCCLPLSLATTACSAPKDDDEPAPPPTGMVHSPNINERMVRVAMVDGKVHVIGGAGAVGPGGASVSVTSEEASSSMTVMSNDDGSFDVVVAGDLDDTYHVKVIGAPAVQVTGKAESGDDAESTATSSGAPPKTPKAKTEAATGASNAVTVSEREGDAAGTDDAADADGTDGAADAADAADAGSTHSQPLTPEEPAAPAPVDCALVGVAALKLQAAAEAAAMAVSCASDAECTLGLSCGGGFTAIPQKLADEHAARMNEAVCASARNDCVGPAAFIEGLPLCVDHVCTATTECGVMEAEAWKRAAALVQAVDKHCETEADCVFATLEVSCLFGCNMGAVSLAGQANLTAQAGELEPLCDTFGAAQCSVTQGGCSAEDIRQHACVDHVCEETH